MDHLCYFCIVLLCFHARLIVDALWSFVGKGLSKSDPIGILRQVWCLIVPIHDLCPLSYFSPEKKI